MQRIVSRRSLLQSVGISTTAFAAMHQPLSAVAKSMAIQETEEPKRGGTLRIAAWNEPRTLGLTNWASDVVSSQIGQNTYNSLVRYDVATGEFVPELAEEWEQTDPQTWVFKLREGVQFHKGYGELTAEDVAFTPNYVIENQGPSLYYYSFLKNVEVLDKYTVQFNLERPHAPFLALTASGHGAHVQSRNAWMEKGEAEFARDPVGTGPFYVDEWVSGDHITLKAFDDFWQPDLPYLDEILWRVIPDPVVRQNALQSGEVDFVDVPVFRNLLELANDPNLVVTSLPGWNWDYMTFDVAKSPFDQKEVRQATSYALNRRAICDAVYYGYGTPTDNMYPPGAPGSGPGLLLFPEEGDPDKARELLAQAGLPDGFEAEVITGSKEHLRRELQIIVDQLSEVGIRLNITQLDEATYTARIRGATDFEIEMSDITLIGPDPDAPTYLFYHSTGIRNHNHADPEIDEMLDEGRQMEVGPERNAHYQELGQRLVDESFYIYVANSEKPRVHTAALKGYVNHPMDIMMRFWDSWLDR